MDPAPSIGIFGALVVLVVSMVMEGGSPASLLLPAPILLVVGVTVLVTIAGGTMADAKQSIAGLKHAFTSKAPSVDDLIDPIVALAEKVRREGMLAVEDQVASLDDPFLQKGLTMAIDGVDIEEVREVLEAELRAKRADDRQTAKFFSDAGGYAPTIGIIGTVMGLVHVLGNLSSPDKLGPLIASAFVATLWGVMSANLVWFPLANRIKRIGQIEATRMELAIEGVFSIQAGVSPRLMGDKLRSLLPANQHGAAEAA